LNSRKEHESKVETLRQALIDSEKSGNAGSLDFQEVKRKARQKAKLVPGK